MAHKLKVDRGTNFDIAVNADINGDPDITGSTIRFTVKTAEYDEDWDDDPTGLIVKNVTSHTDPTNGASEISIIPTDTWQMTPGEYHYDVKIKTADNKVYKLDEGLFILDGSPTNRLS